jgi:hypothetical protein
MHQIRNTRQLREAIAGGHHEFRIVLRYGVYSGKTIYLSANGRFLVDNHIDNTEQRLTDKQLHTRSNIGKAMECGAFIVCP